MQMPQMNNQTIRVLRARLLEKLKENRELHIREYNQAMEQFRLDVIEEMRENLAKAEKGGPLVLHLVTNNTPQNYAGEYDSAISRYEFAEDESVILDFNQCSQYIENKWNWSMSLSNAFYATKAGAGRG